MKMYNHYFQVGVEDEESHNSAKSILLRIGEYFQIQVGKTQLSSVTNICISRSCIASVYIINL